MVTGILIGIVGTSVVVLLAVWAIYSEFTKVIARVILR